MMIGDIDGEDDIEQWNNSCRKCKFLSFWQGSSLKKLGFCLPWEMSRQVRLHSLYSLLPNIKIWRQSQIDFAPRQLSQAKGRTSSCKVRYQLHQVSIFLLIVTMLGIESIEFRAHTWPRLLWRRLKTKIKSLTLSRNHMFSREFLGKSWMEVKFSIWPTLKNRIL